MEKIAHVQQSEKELTYTICTLVTDQLEKINALGVEVWRIYVRVDDANTFGQRPIQVATQVTIETKESL